MNVDKKWTFLDHLPTSSCKRSKWTTPNVYSIIYFRFFFIEADSESASTALAEIAIQLYHNVLTRKIAGNLHFRRVKWTSGSAQFYLSKPKVQFILQFNPKLTYSAEKLWQKHNILTRKINCALLYFRREILYVKTQITVLDSVIQRNTI